MQFTGISAEPGIVEGRICIVHNPDEFGHCTPDHIALLVGVKPNANLVKTVKGIIAIHGGITSHAAIAARENGKPAVVGLPESALEYLKENIPIKLDATKGIVEIMG